MGYFQKGEGWFRLKCDECGCSAQGEEIELNEKGWTWFEMRIGKKEGRPEIINRAYCKSCKPEGEHPALKILRKAYGDD